MPHMRQTDQFQSTPSTRRETRSRYLTMPESKTFQSTPSTRRETRIVQNSPVPEIHFNPLPPHGGRPIMALPVLGLTPFQSTPSTRRETSSGNNQTCPSAYFNPLPPHGGRRTDGICNNSCTPSFQSTPSTRRETVVAFLGKDVIRNFNPLPPHGGRRYAMVSGANSSSFQSTPSTRRETGKLLTKAAASIISIHSLHTEGDMCRLPWLMYRWHFNPLPPHGGRQSLIIIFSNLKIFQSTPSTRRET